MIFSILMSPGDQSNLLVIIIIIIIIIIINTIINIIVVIIRTLFELEILKELCRKSNSFIPT